MADAGEAFREQRLSFFSRREWWMTCGLCVCMSVKPQNSRENGNVCVSEGIVRLTHLLQQPGPG